jgi:hypothetical protein
VAAPTLSVGIMISEGTTGRTGSADGGSGGSEGGSFDARFFTIFNPFVGSEEPWLILINEGAAQHVLTVVTPALSVCWSQTRLKRVLRAQVHLIVGLLNGGPNSRIPGSIVRRPPPEPCRPELAIKQKRQVDEALGDHQSHVVAACT